MQGLYDAQSVWCLTFLVPGGRLALCSSLHLFRRPFSLIGAQRPRLRSRCIAAVGSLIATIVGQVLARRTSRELAERTTKLEQEGKERDARRDYEYEAKKRLYEECEPLLFQTVELVENARDRIASFARSSRSRDLEADGSGWLAKPGYYFTSTAFQLLAPMTSFKIVQRRLTVIDLSLEPQIREQYEILKLLFLSFTRDFDLAGREPVLRYEPDKPTRASRNEPAS